MIFVGDVVPAGTMLVTPDLRHQTQTRFCHFASVSLFFVSLGKSSMVASWKSVFCLLFKFIKILFDLLSMGAV